jgi:hypothetical protein
MGLFDNVKEFFSSGSWGTYVVATENTIPRNPLENSINDLQKQYKLGYTEVGNYIKFGVQDDFPNILERMLRQSPVHSGIITKKAKMVSGNGINYNTEAFRTLAKQAEIKAFINNCAGKNKGLYDVITHAAFQYEEFGAFAFFVKWNKEHNKLVEFRSLDMKGFRLAEPTKDGKVTHCIIRRSFGGSATTMQNNDPKKVKLFDKFDKTTVEQVLYFANPYSGNEFYGVPNYIAAYNFIAADFQFGKHIENSATNGFTPKVMATFVGRNMSGEQKREEYLKFKESFTGPDADNFILSWVRNKDEAPEVKPLDVANLDKTIDVLSRLNDAKILTAHNVTSPTLFGVMVSGKLGGTGNELVTAYQIFRATETLPNRKVLMDAVNRVLATVGYEKIDVSIQEEQINLENIKGANTDNIPAQ